MSSPRQNGNTANLASWVAEGAKQAGALVETVQLATLQNKTHGCCSCLLCQPDKLRCAIPDDTAALLARLPDFDVVVFASPVYFFSFNAQMKQFMDRFMCLVPGEAPETSPLRRIQFAIVATGGGSEKDNGLINMKQPQWLGLVCGCPPRRYCLKAARAVTPQFS